MKRSHVGHVIAGAVTAAGILLGFGAPPEAQAVELGTPATEHPFRTAQNFALEIRFSPYYAQVDDDPNLNGQKPLEKNFGTVPRFFFAIEVDWQTLRIPHLGTIGPGFGVGRVGMSRDVQTVSGRQSADETQLTIYPVAVLRADVFWRELGIPFVPYAKAGLGVGIWRASDAVGTSTTDNVSGKGTSFGTNVAFGVALALDALDLGASRNMDNATGINNTYLFLEGYWLTLDGIAQKNALHVGSNTWSAGLTFEF